eukprot:6201700-Pleurochrysis_carterae.AAC.1
MQTLSEPLLLYEARRMYTNIGCSCRTTRPPLNQKPAPSTITEGKESIPRKKYTGRRMICLHSRSHALLGSRATAFIVLGVHDAVR